MSQTFSIRPKLTLATAGFILAVSAQTVPNAEKHLEFDVATVKPSAPDERNSSMELQLSICFNCQAP